MDNNTIKKWISDILTILDAEEYPEYCRTGKGKRKTDRNITRTTMA